MDNQANEGIKFLHFRYSGADGKVHARGGLTVAYRADQPGVVTHATAKCHLLDNFCKVTGRNKAGGRLLSKRFAQDFKGSEQDFLAALDRDIATYNTYNPFIGAAGLVLGRKFSGKRKGTGIGLGAGRFGGEVNVVSSSQSGGITAAVVNGTPGSVGAELAAQIVAAALDKA